MTMRQTNFFRKSLAGFLVYIAVALTTPDHAAAHCDTLDGPVIQDARLAIAAKDITPVLKWVKPQEEKAVTAAFQKVLADKGKNPEVAEHKFFETLVKIHRAGEGASFTGLKPAGTVEPAVAAADQALVSGSPEALMHLVIEDVVAGIKERYEHAAATYKHKDESVAQGREFVAAYVEFTHYVERLHQDATAQGAHGEASEHGEHKMGGGHSKH
jgi:hypothetical protein